MAQKTMLDLTKVTVENYLNEFNEAIDPKKVGRLTPRNGFYHVLEFEFRDVNKRSQVPIIKAYWKSDRQYPFLKEAVVEIALSSLQAANPIQKFDYTNIVGKVFQVFNMSLSNVVGKLNRVEGQWLWEIAPHNVISESDFHFTLIRLTTNDDGIISVEGDEGIDYDEEANRLDDPGDHLPDDEDWSGFEDETPVE